MNATTRDELPLFDTTYTPQADDMERELARFEAEERKRLGLDDAQAKKSQWFDPITAPFTASQRATTTLLVSGLTYSQDIFLQHALRGIGYRVRAMDVPDYDAFQTGKEFGNRGQCNPTYFTVGNLVKFLIHMRDEQGIPAEDIVRDYVLMSAGACGPCRFGTYVTEYRKALRDAGFDGFRVVLFQQTGGLNQATGEEAGLNINAAFFVAVLKALLVGDCLNAMGYRIRPYEVNAGETNRVIEECRTLIGAALETRKGFVKALWGARKKLAAIEVDRARVRPKVAIIGEFWAMTTEGDGNYKLQQFLESEGAEVDIQIVTAWILYMLWEARWDTKRRMDLKSDDGGKYGLKGTKPWQDLLTYNVADKAVRVIFHSFAAMMGLKDYHLPDMDELAEISHKYYDNASRGGEGHMEVGKLIQNVVHQKVNMTLSVKPFGCMPSSGVSDGVQSLVTALHPEAIFLPIETSGDGAVNVQSRVQMMLFKARQAARKEFDAALEKRGLTEERMREFLAKDRIGHPFYKAPHMVGSTATDMVHAVADRIDKSMPRRTAQAVLRGLKRLRPSAAHA